MGAEHNIDVSYVAGLARLEIEPGAMKRLQQDMEAIVDYIEQLKELEVEGIEPTAHAMPLANVWREDVAGETFNRETMLANAPGTVDDELLKVPQVLPGEGMA